MPTLARRRPKPLPADARERSRGQSIVELALVLPVLLLLLLFAVDFGRIYLGYINMQQMARVAAGFAAGNASAWITTNPDQDAQDRYQDMILNDATTINCDPVLDEVTGQYPDPVFIDGGFSLGNRVEVQINCEFRVLTPVISAVLGEKVDLTASVVYPIREGVVAEVPGGGGPVLSPPEADFYASPQSGYEGMEVLFTDDSTGAVTWEWDFGVDTAFGRGPHPVEFNCPAGTPEGTSCLYPVSLTVGGLGGYDTETKTDYIRVYVPPAIGPIAEFEGSPVTGSAPLSVNFDFVDVRGDTVAYNNYQWDLNYQPGDSSFDRDGGDQESVSYTYSTVGTYSVRLVVTDDGGLSHEMIKVAYVVVLPRVCTVPDFGNVDRSAAQARWAGEGFTTTVQTLPANGGNPDRDYKIHSQSILGGTVDPQPLGCDSPITVGP